MERGGVGGIPLSASTSDPQFPPLSLQGPALVWTWVHSLSHGALLPSTVKRGKARKTLAVLEILPLLRAVQFPPSVSHFPGSQVLQRQRREGWTPGEKAFKLSLVGLGSWAGRSGVSSRERVAWAGPGETALVWREKRDYEIKVYEVRRQ